MIGGYREDPEQANRRREERRNQVVAVVVALAAFAALEFFKDALVASLGLTQSGYVWLRSFIVFPLLILTPGLLQRRTNSTS